MSKMVRVDEADPTRCQGVYAHGQCPYKAEEHSQFCIMHGGNKGAESFNKRATHDYKIQLWQERLDTLAGSDNVKNLRGEIGILRMTLEQVLNQIKTPNQFPVYVDKITSVTRDLKGLVEACQKIEERNKDLLSRTEIMNVADAMINLMSKFIRDPDELLVAGEELHGIITGVICQQDTIGNKPQVSYGTKPVGM